MYTLLPYTMLFRSPVRQGGLAERSFRRARTAEERQYLGRHDPAELPGHRHRHRDRQEGPVCLDRGQRRGGDLEGRPPNLYRDQPETFAAGAAVDVRGEEDWQRAGGPADRQCVAEGTTV